MNKNFNRRDKTLFCEGVNLVTLAEKVDTPAYVYSAKAIIDTYNECVRAFSGLNATVHYALKANHNISVISLFVLKSGREPAPVALRVNPDIDAGTDERITTGKKGNKFGIDYDICKSVFREANELPGINLLGVTMHIGSQLTSIEPYEKAYRKLGDLYTDLKNEGIKLKRIDLGGGLGVAYEKQKIPSFKEWADTARHLSSLDVEISIEPGRSLVANAGVLLSEVIYMKKGEDRNFLIIDAAMNDLVRPAMYGSYHHIDSVVINDTDIETEYDVVGPICESTDTFAVQRKLPLLRQGSLVVIADTGAYGASMSSCYNSRPPAPEVLVGGADWRIIKERIDFDKMFESEFVDDDFLNTSIFNEKV